MMTNKYIRGVTISSTVLICGAFILFSGWSAWNTTEIVAQGKLTASAIQWQIDYGKKIDSLVDANPNARMRYRELVTNATSTQ